MAFLIPSIQFFFSLPRALFCFAIHFYAILSNLPSAILWTWPYHVNWFCSISFIRESQKLSALLPQHIFKFVTLPSAHACLELVLLWSCNGSWTLIASFFLLLFHCKHGRCASSLHQGGTKSSDPISLFGRCARGWNSLEAFNTIRGQCSTA